MTLCPTVFTSLLLSQINQASVTQMKSDICFNTVVINTNVFWLFFVLKKKTFNFIPFFFVTKKNYLCHSTLFLTVQIDLPTSSFCQSFLLSDLVSFIWKLIFPQSMMFSDHTAIIYPWNMLFLMVPFHKMVSLPSPAWLTAFSSPFMLKIKEQNIVLRFIGMNLDQF